MISNHFILTTAWSAMAVGTFWGAGLGLFFQRPDWLGGYGSWRRRLLRLGHIACLGLGLVNLAFAFTLASLSGPAFPALREAGTLCWLLALLTMPTVCALAAWRERLRSFFFIPVGATIGGLGFTLSLLLLS